MENAGLELSAPNCRGGKCETKQLWKVLWNLGVAIKNPAYRILQTEYSGCLDVTAHA